MTDSAPQGKGTRKNILTRIMVSRSEIDMKRIKEEYQKNYGKTLYQEILVSRRTNKDYNPIPDIHFSMGCAHDGTQVKENLVKCLFFFFFFAPLG